MVVEIIVDYKEKSSADPEIGFLTKSIWKP